MCLYCTEVKLLQYLMCLSVSWISGSCVHVVCFSAPSAAGDSEFNDL